MGSTLTPLEALDSAKRFAGDVAADDANVKLRILNNASNRIWMFAPWRWSVGELDQVDLVEDQEDYTITDPGDVIYPIKAELRKATRENVTKLEIVHTLPSQSALKGIPRDLALTSATNLRLRPVPSGLESGDEGKLFTWYKKSNIVIVESGAGSGEANDDNEGALLFPDEWGFVYEEWVLYYCYKLMGDSKMGEIRTDQTGQSAYTGQLATAMDALFWMARKEKVLLDDIGQGVNG